MDRAKDEHIYKYVARMIDEKNNEEINKSIKNLSESDKSAGIACTIFLLRYLLQRDKFDSFKYWMNYLRFDIDTTDVFDQGKNLLMKIIGRP